MKLKDFLKSFDRYDPEMEIMVKHHKPKQCDSDVRHDVYSIKPTHHWELFTIEKDDPNLRKVIVLY